MTNPLALTEELVAVDTVSARDTAPLAAMLEHRMRALGFSVRTVVAPGHPGKLNVVGMRGEGRGGLLLAGHMDTVPWAAGTRATTMPEREGARLYGRGTCDMKGGIAAELVAVERVLAAQRLKRPLWLAFTYDEEVGCLGAKQLLQERALPADVAIVAEPTSLRPVRMHKGYHSAELTVYGRACHSSDPWAGENAIYAMSRVVLELQILGEQLAVVPFAKAPGVFRPDCTTLNVGLVRGGSARNVVPERCTVTLEVRPLPGVDVEGIWRQVRAMCAEAELRFDLVITDANPAMETAPDADVVSWLEGRTLSASGAVAFSTEGKEYNALGMRTVILGPGSIDQAHKEDEYVPIDELEAAAQIYTDAIVHFCG